MPRSGGRLPKRSTERRRRNVVPGETIINRGEAVRVPRLPYRMHPVATRWYNALKTSGQSDYFEPSDWQAAVILAVKLSAHLSSSSISNRLQMIADSIEDKDAAEQLREISRNVPSGSAAEFAALWSAMGDLLTTESARRRARMEVERGVQEEPADKPESIDARRKALQG